MTEVHPLSVIEAMGAGLPVLGIESPGVADTVVNGKDGFVVPEEDLAADRLKNAAATKKLAIFDAFEILTRVENEKNMLEASGDKTNTFKGFAEGRSK